MRSRVIVFPVIFAVCAILSPPAADCLLIGAFNIQVFGKSKAAKPEVMDILVKTLRRYDLVLIQEIRDSSGLAIIQLLDQVNNQTEPHFTYAMAISERLGRTVSKEQYAYFYRDDWLTLEGDPFVYNDGDELLNTETTIVDTFEREPYIAAFSSPNTLLKSFALVGVHIDPDSVVKELTELVKVIADVKNPSILGIDDVMIMGDMNADCGYFPQKYWDEVPLKADTATYQWLIPDDADTTVADSASSGDCAYDRFISTGSGFLATAEGGVVQNSAKVFRFDTAYGLTIDEAKRVSDHYPIEFRLKMDPAVVSTSSSTTVGRSTSAPIQCIWLVALVTQLY